MVDKLKVFLSSAQKEFQIPRKILEKNICQKPFLICELLEKTGALPTNVIDASIKEVRESNIYIGIFGKEYSEITKKEYEEAYKKVKPIFIYVKKINLKEREPKLNELLDQIIKPNFKMHYFKNYKELYDMICKNLEHFIYKLLKDGLKTYQKNQAELIEVEKSVDNISQNKPIEEIPFLLLDEAKVAYSIGDYVSSFMKSFIALETFLRTKLLEYIKKDKNLSKDSKIIERQSLYKLLQYVEKLNLVSSQDLSGIKDLMVTRNNLIHNAIFPTPNIAKLALEYTNKIVNFRFD